MPRATRKIEIEADATTVFDLIHDYDRRLDWDSMLSKAQLLEGATKAGLHARSVCVGTWKAAFLAMETVYVSFEPGKVAAVKLVNRPLFFEHFAATIRHEQIATRRSRTTYVYNFTSRPRWMRFLLEPVINSMMKREVENRLQALKRFIESNS